MIQYNWRGIYLKSDNYEALATELRNYKPPENMYAKVFRLECSDSKPPSKEAMDAICKVIELTHPWEINLSGSNIGDEGLQGLCPLLSVTFSLKLNLHNCNIGDKGAKYLGKHLKVNFMKIKSLDIGENDINFPGYYALRKVIKSKLYCEDNPQLASGVRDVLSHKKEYGSKSDFLKSCWLSIRNLFELGFSFTKHEEWRMQTIQEHQTKTESSAGDGEQGTGNDAPERIPCQINDL